MAELMRGQDRRKSMAYGFDSLLEKTNRPGLSELRSLVAEVLGGHDRPAQLLAEENLSRERVFRLRFQVDGQRRSLVAKILPLERALREQRVIARWLPRLGLSEHAPCLLGTAAESGGDRVWHVYECLPGHTLKELARDRAAVTAAVNLIARVHRVFVDHPLLAECRLVGQDLGPQFLGASVRDAMRALEALRRLVLSDRARIELVDRLLGRLERLAAEQVERTEALNALGWPETLQHGDLWTTNVMVSRDLRSVRAQMIDWDHVGIGPAAYDLSAFLRHFPARERAWILEVYRGRVAHEQWSWPSASELNYVFESADLARFANCTAWAALAATQMRAGALPDWAFEDLKEIDTWFQNRSPLLETLGEAA
jgi:hypothetical protein